MPGWCSPSAVELLEPHQRHGRMLAQNIFYDSNKVEECDFDSGAPGGATPMGGATPLDTRLEVKYLDVKVNR